MIDAVAVQVLNVLLVEDDPSDVLLAREAFEQSRSPARGNRGQARAGQAKGTSGPPRPSALRKGR